MVKPRHWRKWIYRRVVKLRSSPYAVARGMALGVIFGCLMPPGLQVVTGIPVALLLGGNVSALVAGTCISNPVTFVPLYVFTCQIGQVFLNAFGYNLHLGADLEAAVQTVLQLDLMDFFLHRLRPLISCWICGGLLVGLAASVPTYYVTYIVVVEVQRLRQFSHARRAARREALRARAAARPAPTTSDSDEETPAEQSPPRPQ